MAQAPRTAVPTGGFSDDPLENASSWLQNNLKPVLAVVGGAAVLSLAIWGYRSMDASKKEDAGEALYQAQSTMLSGNLPGADSAYGRVIASYGNTAAGQQAVMLQAQVRYELKQYDAGIKGLQDRIGSVGDDFKPAFNKLIAAGYEAKGDLAQAAEFYGKAAAASRFESDKGDAKVAQARALMAAGKMAEAKVIWEELAKNDEFSFAQEARVRLGEIAGASAAAGAAPASR